MPENETADGDVDASAAPGPAVELVELVVDAAEPAALAAFWGPALGWEVIGGGGSDVVLVPTDVTSFGLRFRSSPNPKVGQNRIHLDLTTSSDDDQAATVDEFLARGARHLDLGQRPEEGHIVLADPEGNELCVLAPGNRFLAGCPRLGAVNCDGSAALGRFWSAALGWPLVWEEGEETAVQAPGGVGPKITWSGPPYLPRLGPERLHVHVAPVAGTDRDAAVARLRSLGAVTTTTDTACAGAVALDDVDGNPICVVSDPAGRARSGA